MRLESPEVTTSFKFKNPSGLFDILPQNLRYWHHSENVLKKLAVSFGYNHLILPPVDPKSLYTEAFGEGFGDSLVNSSIKDGGEHYVLRAHPRLGLIRSYKENGFDSWPAPFRVYFQTETLQKIASGHQHRHFFCLDCLEAHDATTSASVFVLLRKLGQELGLRNAILHLHSSGCRECRPSFDQKFFAKAEPHKSELCRECSNNLTAAQVTNCAVDSASAWLATETPPILDSLCPACHAQLSTILETCDELDISYDVNPLLFANWPEAEQTTFALHIGQETVPSIVGYHYNTLASKIAGEPLGALGITIDLELLSHSMESHRVSLPDAEGIQVFVAQLGAQAKSRCMPLLQQLYGAGYCVVTAGESESITQQLLSAERMHARITLIIGQKEAAGGHVIMRDMVSGLQDDVYMEDLIPTLQERLAVSY